MNEILLQSLNPIKRLSKNFRVKKLFAFGSVNTNRFNSKSDIDLLVTFDKMPVKEYPDNYFALVEELEKIFNRKVDLVVDKSVSNPYLVKSIEATKVPLYE